MLQKQGFLSNSFVQYKRNSIPGTHFLWLESIDLLDLSNKWNFQMQSSASTAILLRNPCSVRE